MPFLHVFTDLVISEFYELKKFTKLALARDRDLESTMVHDDHWSKSSIKLVAILVDLLENLA